MISTKNGEQKLMLFICAVDLLFQHVIQILMKTSHFHFQDKLSWTCQHSDFQSYYFGTEVCGILVLCAGL